MAYAGCHDNRMDKIWWNEQWMSWPIGPQYAASSNVDNAHRLQGAVLLVVGELDTNVDPSSTMQVVNALIKANKTFDLLVIPGAEHSAGRSDGLAQYGERKRFDFFVHAPARQGAADVEQRGAAGAYRHVCVALIVRSAGCRRHPRFDRVVDEAQLVDDRW